MREGSRQRYKNMVKCKKITAYYHKNLEKILQILEKKLDGGQHKKRFHLLSVKLTILQYHSKGQHDHQETSHITIKHHI